MLSPWAIRNQIQFGRPIVTTTHGGYTLLLANNPEFYDWLRSGSWGSVWQADQFNANWDRRRSGNELQADRQAYAEAWQTIRAEPGTFLYACAVRIGRFWSPLPHQLAADETPLRRLSRYTVASWYLAEFTLAMLGIWRLFAFSPLPLGEGPGVRAAERRGGAKEAISTDAPDARDALTLTLSQRERGHVSPSALPLPPSTWLWGFLLVACLLVGHVVYWTDMRMRAPAMPVVALLAASGLLCLAHQNNDRN